MPVKQKKTRKLPKHIQRLRNSSHAMVKKKHHFFTFFDFNHVVKVLILSEVIVTGAFGLLAPIFSIFIADNIPGGDAQVAGVAITVFLLTRSLGQIPIGIMIDRLKGERDDLVAMVVGTLFAGFIPLLYIFVDSIGDLYVVQFLYGLASAIIFPAWTATFTRHIDEKHEGAEWGAYRSFTDLGMAITAGVGGFIASTYSFDLVFILVSLLTFAAAFHLLCLRNLIVKKHKHHGRNL